MGGRVRPTGPGSGTPAQQLQPCRTDLHGHRGQCTCARTGQTSKPRHKG